MLLATALKGNLTLTYLSPINLLILTLSVHNTQCKHSEMSREYTVHEIEASKETKFTLLSLQV